MIELPLDRLRSSFLKGTVNPMHKFAESDGKAKCTDCAFDPMGNCPKHHHVSALSLDHFLLEVKMEIFRARMLYPSCEGVGMAMLEEVGEVANACLDRTRAHVVKEAVQACAMVARLALEGDPSLAALRQRRDLDE